MSGISAIFFFFLSISDGAFGFSVLLSIATSDRTRAQLSRGSDSTDCCGNEAADLVVGNNMLTTAQSNGN